MNTQIGTREGVFRYGPARRFVQWLDMAPHPLVAVELAPGYAAAARWGRVGTAVEAFEVQPLSEGAITPSAVETNLGKLDELRAAVAKVLAHVHGKGQAVALLVPDTVVRVFVLHFDELPRSNSEALPLLRWRLKKSVPFETDEMLISFTRQPPRDSGVDVVTAVSRLRIIREYEQLLESAGVYPGVVMSSALAAVPLLDDRRPSLLARISGKTLTTAIVREGLLCGYRCTELPADENTVTPQALLDEIYPLATYYQDSWGEPIAMVYLAGLANRMDEFRAPMQRELGCSVGPLLGSAVREGHLPAGLQPLIDRDLDALAGWTLNRGA